MEAAHIDDTGWEKYLSSLTHTRDASENGETQQSQSQSQSQTRPSERHTEDIVVCLWRKPVKEVDGIEMKTELCARFTDTMPMVAMLPKWWHQLCVSNAESAN